MPEPPGSSELNQEKREGVYHCANCDVLDTCFNLQLKQSGDILLSDIDQLLASIKKQANG